MNQILNIFYEEPNPDRWFKYDRYPRQIIRRIIRGKARPGGVMMVALELMRGLDILNIAYRFNDYSYAKRHPNELICVIGKPHLIFEERFKNPIIFGAGVFSHPIECLDFFQKYTNVKKMLVPGPWMEKMCKPYYGDKVMAWPVGIDTKKWSPEIKNDKPTVDFLIYNKIRWENPLFEAVINELTNQGLTYTVISYGHYKHIDLMNELSSTKAVIFLCEHETQGIAYQQILATDTPILAWDEGGYWSDPSFYPHLVKFKPVSSVPYWNDACGIKFKDIDDFTERLKEFVPKLQTFSPRSYIMKNLTLELCAEKYLSIVKSVNEDLTNS
ncbi:hypothetical protein [Pedobacter frigiditerrae]|uniref:hypothetical protein n=1 Tax=Pedobacter frigiditerrae TaxID=2530452 RepID=UPI00292D11FF|nr:hypothetical protein [Pedobacter frigiditerrae]